MYYDGSCAICRASRRWLERRDRQRRVTFVDACGPAVEGPCPVPREQLDRAVWARLPEGRLVSGYEALLAAVAALPRWRVLAGVGGTRPFRGAGALIYRVVAKHRHGRWPG